jgi:hypothetical protein
VVLVSTSPSVLVVPRAFCVSVIAPVKPPVVPEIPPLDVIELSFHVPEVIVPLLLISSALLPTVNSAPGFAVPMPTLPWTISPFVGAASTPA